MRVPPNLSISALLRQTGLQGGVSSPGVGISLLPDCFLTASPPIVLTIYGASAVNVYGAGTVNAYVRNVPNRLLSPHWQSLHLMETSVVFTALLAPAHPTFTALRVRTVHPKLIDKKNPEISVSIPMLTKID